MMDQHTTTQISAEGQSLLVFRVGRVDCAVPVRTVDSIIMPQPLTPLPRQGEDYLGVLQYRDHAVPVVSLQRKFGQTLPAFDQGRFIMADVGGQVTGFWVDEILEIIEPEDYQWSDSPRFCPDDSFPRTLLWGERIVLYSDFSRLLSLHESAALEQWLDQDKAAEEDESLDEATPLDDTKEDQVSSVHDEGVHTVAQQAATTTQVDDSPPVAAAESQSEVEQTEAVPAGAIETDTDTTTHGEAIELSSFLDPAAPPLDPDVVASDLSVADTRFELLSGPEQAEAALETAAPEESEPDLGVAPLTEVDSLPRPASRSVSPQASPVARGTASKARPVKAGRRRAPVSQRAQPGHVAKKPSRSSVASARGARVPWPAVACLSLLLAILLTQAAHLIGERLEWRRLAQAEPLRLLSEQVVPLSPEHASSLPAPQPVPGPVREAPSMQAVTKMPGQAASLRGGPPWNVHFVVPGDTLWALSARYLDDPFRYPDLARWSRIRNPDRIYPDDKVLYPYPLPVTGRIQPF